MSVPRLLSGARAILKFNNNTCIYATDVSYTYKTMFTALREVDDSLSAELIPGPIEVSVICNKLRAPFDSPTVDGLQATISNILVQPYVSIQVLDRATDTTIMYVDKAMLTSRQGQVGAKGLGSETWTFAGIGFWDERPPQES